MRDKTAIRDGGGKRGGSRIIRRVLITIITVILRQHP